MPVCQRRHLKYKVIFFCAPNQVFTKRLFLLHCFSFKNNWKVSTKFLKIVSAGLFFALVQTFITVQKTSSQYMFKIFLLRCLKIFFPQFWKITSKSILFFKQKKHCSILLTKVYVRKLVFIEMVLSWKNETDVLLVHELHHRYFLVN